VALVSLSNILHQVHYSNEAAIVIHAAIEVCRELSVNYFTLGNIYAVMHTKEREREMILIKCVALLQ